MQYGPCTPFPYNPILAVLVSSSLQMDAARARMSEGFPSCVKLQAAQLIEVLCCKLVGHGFDSQWCH